MGQPHHRDHEHIQQRLLLLDGGFQKTLRDAVAGVVDQPVHLGGCLLHLLELFTIGQVRCQNPTVAQFVGQVVEPPLVACNQNQLSGLAGQFKAISRPIPAVGPVTSATPTVGNLPPQRESCHRRPQNRTHAGSIGVKNALPRADHLRRDVRAGHDSRRSTSGRGSPTPADLPRSDRSPSARSGRVWAISIPGSRRARTCERRSANTRTGSTACRSTRPTQWSSATGASEAIAAAVLALVEPGRT